MHHKRNSVLKITSYICIFVFLLTNNGKFANTFIVSANAAISVSEAVEYATSNGTILRVDSPYIWENGVKKQIDKNDPSLCPVFVNNNVYVPMRFMGSILEAETTWYGATQSAFWTFKGFIVQFNVDKSEYTINGIKRDKGLKIIKINDRIFVPIDIAADVSTKNILVDRSGIALITNYNINLPQSEITEFVLALMPLLFYERPSKEKILADALENNPDKNHPRIMLTPERVEEIKGLKDVDPMYERWVRSTIVGADASIDQPVAEYKLNDRGEMLELSRSTVNLMMRLGMAYQLTGETKYAERVWNEIEAISLFPNWNPYHFLDTAEMSVAFAVAYDWCYDYYDDDQRKFIQKLIYENALYPAYETYMGTAQPNNFARAGFARVSNNWNVVCNGGIAIAALAIIDEEEYSDMASQCIEFGLKSLERLLKEFAPDGAWVEGIGYWHYTVRYLTMYMSALDTVLNTDYGCFDVPGVKETGYFPVYINGPSNMFNYGDSSVTGLDVPEWNYFAYKLNDPGLMATRMKQVANGGGGVKDLLWHRPEMESKDKFLTLDKMFGGTVEVASMRDSWNDDALFIASRAGKTVVNHGHLDTGSFVLQANGVYWARDMGSAGYNNQGYFDLSGPRWIYYRARAESHNTLVINPSEEPEFALDSFATAKLTSKERGAFWDIDMTDLYKNSGVKSARRAIGLIDNRTKFIVQDEVVCNEPSEMYWFMHTMADIKVQGDGSSAVLTSGTQRLFAKIISPSNANFSVMNDGPLPTSIQLEDMKVNENVKKLAVNLRDVMETTISVIMIPLRAGEDLPTDFPELKPIDEWEIPDGEIPTLDNIKVDGKPINGFNSATSSYTMDYEEKPDVIPQIEAESEYQTRVTQASDIPGAAIIELLDSDGKNVKNYYVNFNIKPVIGIVSGKTKYRVEDVSASEVPEAMNPPIATIDNDLTTRWAAEGQQWIMYDLGARNSIDSVAIAWTSGNTRQYNFTIEISNDTTNWQQVYSGKSGGRTADFEMYSFNSAQTRYVRIVGNGNSVNRWNNILEVGIYGTK